VNFGFAFPPPHGVETGSVSPSAAAWNSELGEYVLEWDDARAMPDPYSAAIDFGRSVIRHACAVCNWNPDLASSAQAIPPPLPDLILEV